MTYRYGTSYHLAPYYDYYFSPSTTINTSPSIYYIPLKVCTTRRNLKRFIFIDILSSETLEKLKEKVAYSLEIDTPLDQFSIEILDEQERQWKRITALNSSATLKQLTIFPNSILSVAYHSESIADDQRSHNLTSTTSKNYDLTLKLCRKPLDSTEYITWEISSSSTLGKLREQVYAYFNKVSMDRPIYLLNEDNWTKYESDMDAYTLAEQDFRSIAFISIEPDVENFNSKLPRGLCGLANLGSTCFMNSVFQCLSNIPSFTKQVFELPDQVNAPTIAEYRKLMKRIWSGTYDSLDPTSLVRSINENLPRYASYRQQDAQEFMTHFLHLIHSEFATKDTLITDLFYGQIQSTVKCLNCQRAEKTNESISFLPLPISNYSQKSILYVRTDGEYRLVSFQVDASIRTISDLIDCFLSQTAPSLSAERIRAIHLIDNVFHTQHDTRTSLTEIREEELVFLECPEKSSYQRYILCEFIDYIVDKPFRPPIVLVSPIDNCHYRHLSEQIDQLLGHLCSVTDAPISACRLYWTAQREKQQKLNRDDYLPRLSSIIIEMSAEWVDIYKVHNNINCSTDNSALTSLIADFFREEPLHGNYHCLKCPKPTKARKEASLCLPSPQVLIIQLKRFTYDMYSNDKIDTYISFPLYGLDLQEYLVEDKHGEKENQKSTKYNLVAVSNHMGSLLSGHYTTYAKNIDDGNWYSFDDKIVKRIAEHNDVITKNAYILVYVLAT